jgi:hypothetical protein
MPSFVFRNLRFENGDLDGHQNLRGGSTSRNMGTFGRSSALDDLDPGHVDYVVD